MEAKDLKTFSIVCGSISFVITMWGFPTYFQLLQVIFSPKLVGEDVSPEKHIGRFVTITGNIRCQDSFMVSFRQNQTDKKDLVVFSRIKTKFHVIGTVPRQLFNKSVKYVNFFIDSQKPVKIAPAYHTKIKADKIYEKYNQSISSSESFFYAFLKLLLMPMFSLFGMTIKTGETITEKALYSKSFVTVAGRLKSTNGELSMVPDFIAPKYSRIQSYLAGKAFWVLLGQAVFATLSAVLWRYSVKREKELRDSKKDLVGTKNLKCSDCVNPCNMFFEPCLDMVLCSKCSETVNICPKCSKAISVKIPIHLS